MTRLRRLALVLGRIWREHRAELLAAVSGKPSTADVNEGRFADDREGWARVLKDLREGRGRSPDRN